jgi:hypothetical protein
VIPNEGIPQLIDYKNHGRNEFPILTADEQIYLLLNLEMWCPQHVIVDSEGFVRHKGIMVDEGTEETLISILKEGKARSFSQKCSKGICTRPSTEHKLVQRNPRMAVDDNNTVYVVYTSNEQGNNDIYLRAYDLNEVDTIKITGSLADDCWPDVLIDKSGNVWVVWLSNKGGFYDVHARYIDKGAWSEEFRITSPYIDKDNPSLNGEHIEDAATPCLGMEKDGTVWVCYCRWNTFYKDNLAYSLDREIYAAYFDGQKWVHDMQVSPTEQDMMEPHDDHFFPFTD